MSPRKYTRPISDDRIREAHEKYYKQGVPTDSMEDEYGVRGVTLMANFRRLGLPIHTRRSIRQTRYDATDWTPLADIKPVTGIPGYAVVTKEEAARIRDFYKANQHLSAIMIAEYLGITPNTVHRIIWCQYNATRPALPTPEGKRIYQQKRECRAMPGYRSTIKIGER